MFNELVFIHTINYWSKLVLFAEEATVVVADLAMEKLHFLARSNDPIAA